MHLAKTSFRIAWAFLLTTAVASAQNQAPVVAIQNDFLSVTWERSDGRLAFTDKATGRTFLKKVRLRAEGGTAGLKEVHDPHFGPGKALEIRHPDRGTDAVMLFHGVPFALIRSQLENGGAEARMVHEVNCFSGKIDAGVPGTSLKTFGTGGLLSPEKNPGSYAWLGVVRPETRQGVVLGWVSHDRGSGVLFSGMDADVVTVEAELEYGRLRLKPGQVEPLETLAVGWFEDARLGLESWAMAVAKVYDIRLKPQPSGYCTWYSKPHGGASDERHLAELSAFAATNLAPFGFSVVQIDDKWQAGISTNGPRRNFTTHRPDGPYPSGMKAAADQVKSLGLTPGIWFMPFAGTYYDPFFRENQDWFVRRADGGTYETSWGGTCLDMTHPGAREHLRDVAHRIAADWGYEYFKVDGLWTGTGTRQQYVNSGYKDDAMGDALFHNPDKTHIEAYRDGLRLLRETAGPKVFILGCNGPQNMRSYGGAFGLVDAMRIGPDNGAEWKSLVRGPVFGSRHYFLHGRIWLNDPDPVYVRASMPLHHARLICSWVALSGQLNLSSEWLPGLPPERLDLLKRTLPAHDLLPRPADLFEDDPPRFWVLENNKRSGDRAVIGVFNWESEETVLEYDLGRLGLKSETLYAGFDFWQDAPTPMLQGRLTVTVPAESCQIIAVRPVAPHPQVISTSRHITQGITDLAAEEWDAQGRVLNGRSRVVAGDPYELRILTETAPTKTTLSRADAGRGATAKLVSMRNGIARVKIDSPVTGEIDWALYFE